MAKSVPQHRFLLVAPSNGIIPEVDEEDSREQSIPSIYKHTTGVRERRNQTDSQESITDSFHSSFSHMNEPEEYLSASADKPKTLFTVQDCSKVQTTTAGCRPSSLVKTKQNEMEHDSLLLHGSQQCNGGVQNRRAQSPPSFFNERRATMTTSDGTERHRYNTARNSPSHPAAANRSLSVSLGSSKEFSVTVGSQDLFPRGSDHLGHSDDATKSSNKLDTEGKHQAKYGSTLTNIGVEYMKATGTMGVRFQQLQNPNSKKHDSVGNLSSDGQGERRNSSTVVTNLCNDLPLIIPMNANMPKPLNTLETAKANHRSHRSSSHHHAGYRLGQRKVLAEQRRRIADYSCLFALIGLLLMIIEMECTIGNLYTKVRLSCCVHLIW